MKRVTIPFFLVLCFQAWGQEEIPKDTLSLSTSDSIFVKRGNRVVSIESYAARYNPRKAILYAAVLPGAGQAYNNKYWKIPLVYGGFVGLGIAMNYNQERFLVYKGQLFSLLNEPDDPEIDQATGLTALGNRSIGGQLVTANGLKIDQLRNIVNRYRRDRDFCVIMTFIWYVLQMVDAHIDAHLKEFDVNPQLKVSLEPVMRQNYFTGKSTGLSISLKF